MEANSEAWYRALFETTLDAIMIVDGEGRYVEVNDSLCRLLKAPRERLIRAPFTEFIPAPMRESASTNFRELKDLGSFTGEFSMQALDGSRVELEWRWKANFVPGLHFCVARDITTRKATERELERKQKELEDFVENATLGLHWVGPDGTILWANRAELELLGYSRDEYIGHPIAEFHADPPVIEDILRRLSAKEELHSYEARLRCKDGSLRYVLISSNVRWDEDRFIHTRCFTRDITERKQAQARRAAILETALDAIITMDHEGRVREFNPAAERIFGYRRADVLGQLLAELIIPPQLREGHYRGLKHYLATGEAAVLGQRLELTALRADGSEFPIELSITRIPTEGPPVFTGYLRDISEQKRAEEERAQLLVREQQARAHAEALAAERAVILKELVDGVIITDSTGRIVFVNDAAQRIHGVAKLEVPVEQYTETYHLFTMDGDPYPPEELPLARAVTRQETVVDAQWRIRRPDGREVIAQGSATPVLAPDGTQLGAVLLLRDVTAQRQLEQEKDQLVGELREASRRKDAFLAMLGHELRNPLGAISNALALLQSSKVTESMRQRATAIIERQLQHQARLVADLLDVSRIAREKLPLEQVRVDLTELVRETAEDQRGALSQANLTLELEFPDTPVHTVGDPTRLSQVLRNLLTNAIKFTDPGGRVTVEVAAAEGGTSARMIVRDTGIGIEPEMLPHVFDAFAQAAHTQERNRGGLGLGLALVKGLVDLHGGQVSVESGGLGQGATVTLLLPLEESSQSVRRSAVG